MLGFIAIFSLLELFDLSVISGIDKLYGYWAVTSLSIFAPMYGLTKFPRYQNRAKNELNYNVFTLFILKFITVPFIVLYFIILYAYSVRVLSDISAWPNGIISWMVIGFATFGYIVYVIAYAYESKHKLIQGFRRLFPWVVIPQLGMLFYALYLRIDQYDLTINRYLALIFGVWLLIVSLYFVLGRAKYILALPASLALMALIFSIGPWSLAAYPVERQYNRLLINLEQAHILKEDKIVPLVSVDMYDERIKNIVSQIEYVCEHSDCDQLERLFAAEIARASADSSSRDDASILQTQKQDSADRPSYETVSLILSGLNIDRNKLYIDHGYTRPYLNFSLNRSLLDLYPLDIKGYDRIVGIRLAGQTENLTYPYILWDPDLSTAQYHTSSGVVESFPISVPESFLSRNSTEVSPQDLTFQVKNTQRELVLVFTNFPIKNPKHTARADDSYGYSFAEGLALVRDIR